MSGKLMGQIYKLKLTPAKREILLAMAENADDNGSNCKPGVPYIAWKTDYSERQVQRIQQDLISDKLLVIVDTPVRSAVEYRIDVAAGILKPAFVPRKERRKGDRIAPSKGDNMTPIPFSEGDNLSQEVELRVTSHGKDENAKGDIGTGKMTSIPLKDYPLKEQTNRARELRKDYDDVPKDDRLQIIRAWAGALSATPIGAYKNDSNHKVAAEIFREGYRAPQVALFVNAKKQDAYWRGKTLTLSKVAELMPEWLMSQKQKVAPPEVVKRPNIVPEEWGVNHFVREVQQ